MNWKEILEALRPDEHTILLLGVVLLGAWSIYLMPGAGEAKEIALVVLGGLLTAYRGKGS